ncbi:heme-binding domain-containing protein [Solitalea sp. MAHUQ-68]|uniref:Heme-binding domain-containing protein n=1 Tax=Solitalea agri TaxID=2953739 RepID=A0A9X2F4F5_9SPHI|nr:heme-binding domain-containing protein [Solitalea agri]MCO4291648.1 heme-binding domain-containing protein [Solitalea agri]
MKKKILYGLLILLVIIQFIRPTKNQSNSISANDISKHYSVPSDVQESLKVACADCHSNNTNYPWYTNIQPVGWWMQHHVNEGKEHLNFSEFIGYSPKKANHKLKEVIESQEEGWMPLESYLWIHNDAKLTKEQKGAIIAWAKTTQQQIQTANPGVDFTSKK